MKKATKKQITALKKAGWKTSDQVFKSVSNTKKFKNVYDEERLRLRLAQQIRTSRVKKNLTQAKLAKRANMTQSVVARIEAGQHGVSVDTLGRVATALGKEVQIS